MTAFIDTLASFVLTLGLHATVLLGAVWLVERSGVLRHPGWLELAWRGALFGALLSSGLSVAPLGALANRVTDLAKPAAAIPAPATTMADRVALRDSGAATHAIPVRPAVAAAASRDALSTATQTRRTPWQIPQVAALALVSAWLAALACAGLALLRQAHALRRLRLQTLHRTRPVSAELQRCADALAATMHLAPPTLSLDAHIASPMLLSTRHLLLPAWSEALHTRQQQALLAHEFAHLHRRDPRWRIAHRLALLPLCFLPLAWLARRRLDALAEDACDSHAAALLGDGRPLAECLATCIAATPPRSIPRPPALAVAMAGNGSAVVRRVHRLLEDTVMPSTPLSPVKRRLALTVALAGLVLLPGLAVTTVANSRDTSISISVHSDDGDEELSYSMRQPGHELSIEKEGQVEFSADETDVVAMDDDASLEIEETRDGVERKIEFSSNGKTITRLYRVDGNVRPLDADAHAWIGRVLPALFRETGLQAETRAKRLLANGGTPALLDEIDLIEGDYARRIYLDQLFHLATLTPQQIDRAFKQAAAIASDYELRGALQAAFETQTLPEQARLAALQAATSIESDFELAELLVAASDDNTPLGGETLAAWNTARRGIESDFEKRRVLTALLEQNDDSPATIAIALDAAREIESDFDARELLTLVARQARTSTQAIDAYLLAVDTLDSSFERSQALLALLPGDTLEAASAGKVLASIAQIDGSYEASQTLTALAEVMPSDAGVIDAYRKVAATLGEYERQQAEAALGRTVRVY